MNKPKLTYFDAPVSRGEECRLALHLAGIDFEDERISAAAWPAMKEQTPYGGLPVLELPGRPPLAHSNAILVLIGRQHGLHPADDFEAARHEGMMQHVEDLRATVTPTIRMGDAEKRVARETIVAGFLPAWASHAERNIPGAPFFGGAKLHVVDLKLHMAVRWFIGGKVDYIHATLFAGYPKLTAVCEAVRDHPGVSPVTPRVESRSEVMMMLRRIALLAILGSVFVTPTLAALKPGEPAPDFKIQASLGGKVFMFSLADALKKGPVVLYFYPAAFTEGCTIEAHDFADAMDAYHALGATVIGVSHDKIDTLNRFSISECRSKFAVAADEDQRVMKSYDAVLAMMPKYADRVSYVIAPDGRILYAYTSLNPDKHVANTLDALRKWSAQQKH